MRVGFPVLVATVLSALALGAPQAHAEVLQLSPHEQTITTPDGWQVTVGHKQESANKVAPLNGIFLTREVFVTNQAYGRLGGSGTSLQGVVMKTGYHLGCGMDVTSISLGASVTAGLSPGINISAGIPTPTVGASITPNFSVTPSFNVTLTPGKVVDLPLGEKVVNGQTAYITNRDVHVKLDGCAAQAAIRSYTIIAVKSAEADDSVAVYGDPVPL